MIQEVEKCIERYEILLPKSTSRAKRILNYLRFSLAEYPKENKRIEKYLNLMKNSFKEIEILIKDPKQSLEDILKLYYDLLSEYRDKRENSKVKIYYTILECKIKRKINEISNVLSQADEEKIREILYKTLDNNLYKFILNLEGKLRFEGFII